MRGQRPSPNRHARGYTCSTLCASPSLDEIPLALVPSISPTGLPPAASSSAAAAPATTSPSAGWLTRGRPPADLASLVVLDASDVAHVLEMNLENYSRNGWVSFTTVLPELWAEEIVSQEIRHQLHAYNKISFRDSVGRSLHVGVREIKELLTEEQIPSPYRFSAAWTSTSNGLVLGIAGIDVSDEECRPVLILTDVGRGWSSDVATNLSNALPRNALPPAPKFPQHPIS